MAGFQIVSCWGADYKQKGGRKEVVLYKIDLLVVGKPIDPMARRVSVADETHGVWTAREEPRGSPFLLMSTFRLRICAARATSMV